mmetsp:Transcript_69521/g.166670  ORF Transcript_69521/g.166670 Transcript_69521/m.166670 type:complete len:88 (-) Transcript_69521:2324-2587(-)
MEAKRSEAGDDCLLGHSSSCDLDSVWIESRNSTCQGPQAPEWEPSYPNLASRAIFRGSASATRAQNAASRSTAATSDLSSSSYGTAR